jgi:hypothetical protein
MRRRSSSGVAIQRLIEQSLRLDPRTTNTLAAMLEAANDVWGSKRPSGYQIDGAVRLLQILECSRGAMLTDEPGLGKTLTAQLAVAVLIKDRIARRIELATDLPVRVTIVAPARVLGATKRGEPTQWFLYATEIRAAVRAPARRRRGSGPTGREVDDGLLPEDPPALGHQLRPPSHRPPRRRPGRPRACRGVRDRRAGRGPQLPQRDLARDAGPEVLSVSAGLW